MKNPWFSHLLKATLTLALVVYVLHGVSMTELASAFARANPAGLALSTLLVVAGVVYLQAVEISYSMRRDVRIPVLQLCRINLALMFYTLFLPTAATFFVRHSKYVRAGYGNYDSVALVGFHKLLQLAMACAAALIAVVIMFDSLGRYSAYLLALLLVCAAPFAILLSLVLSRRGAIVLGRITRAIDLWLPAPPAGAAASLRTRCAVYLRSLSMNMCGAFQSFASLERRQLLLVLVCTLLQHVFIVLSAYVVLDMIAPGVGFAPVMLVRSLIVLLLAIPVSIGGVGVREFAFYTLFPLFGVAPEDAIASSLLLFGIQLFVSFLGALVECHEWLTNMMLVDRKVGPA